jgi:hypothetical protein
MDATEQRGGTERLTNACLRMAAAHSGRWARVTSSRAELATALCLPKVEDWFAA